MAAGRVCRGLAGDETALGTGVKPAVMKGCQIGHNRHKGGGRALLFDEPEKELLHERVHRNDEVGTVHLQRPGHLFAAERVDQAQHGGEGAFIFKDKPKQLPEPEGAGNERAVKTGQPVDRPGGVVGPEVDDFDLKAAGETGGEGGLQGFGAGPVAAPGIAHQNQDSAH